MQTFRYLCRLPTMPSSLAQLSVLNSMLSDPHARWYGLELARSANLKSGTIYPMLARLERCGWLSSEWENIDASSAGRPRRRLYRLTPQGELAATRELAAAQSQLAKSRRKGSNSLRPDFGAMLG
jgi:PadR family transcriptional regulator PadR